MQPCFNRSSPRETQPRLLSLQLTLGVTLEICSVVSLVSHFLGLGFWLLGNRVGIASSRSPVAAPGPWLVQLNSRPVLKEQQCYIQAHEKELCDLKGPTSHDFDVINA